MSTAVDGWNEWEERQAKSAREVKSGTAVLEPDVITPEAKKGSEAIALRYSGESDIDLATCAAMSVVTDEEYTAAGELRKVLDRKLKQSETARDALVRPLNEHVKWINSIFKPAQEKWKQAMGILSDRRISYDNAKRAEAERVRREQEEAARREQERLNKLAEERAKRALAKGDTERAEEIRMTVPIVSIPVTLPSTLPPKVEGIARQTYTFCNVRDDAESRLAFCIAVASGELPLEAIPPKAWESINGWLSRRAETLRGKAYLRVWSEEREKGTGR